WFARERRSFLHLAHAVGIALMGLVSLPWVLLNLRAVGLGEDSVENWAAEIAMRGDFGKFDLERWLTTPFRIVGGYLPWSVPLLYSLWHLKKGHLSVSRNRREEAVIFGSLVSIAFGFFGVCLMPLNTPRYLMPVYPLAALATMALYQRLPDAAKARYEHFGRQALKFLIPLTLLVPPALAFMLWKKGEPFPIATTVAGPLLVVAASTLVFGPWRLKSLFLSTALVIAAGGLGIIPVAQSFQSERNMHGFTDAYEVYSVEPDGQCLTWLTNGTPA
ncbi:MAG TPA: hypothetical protein PLA50_03980, partial [Bacteroidia bacterium]|nr:hypothetical protein [Bacteroidia bacterium]